MTVSIPLVLILGVLVYVAWKYMGLRVWHAAVCTLFGFMLASTAAEPEISRLLDKLSNLLTG